MDTNDSNINNTMYLKFHNVYPCWNFIIAALAINAVAMFGMVSNFAVIWVTYRTKWDSPRHCQFSDRSLLLLRYASRAWPFAVPLHCAIWPKFPSHLFRGSLLLRISLFGIGGIAVSIAFTGLDRLLCVLFPAFPRRVRPLPYLSAITLLCLASSVCTLIGYYKKNNETPNFMVTGTFSDLVSDPSLLLYAFILYSVTVLIYLITGFVIRKRAKKASNSSSSSAELINRRIFRSLLVIVLLNVGGSYVNLGFLLFIYPFFDTENPILAWTVAMFMGILTVNVSSASNGPILYFTSNEYRSAFQREFNKIRRFFFPNSSSVQPIATVLAIQRTVVTSRQTVLQKRMEVRRGTSP
ncbi:hypothetical protein niasHS_008331 [Heterodera schachtii]|uniref:G-protein coupled receptors family 1 profile domain-containing protein n=1 Tax=Heterodera schachtii TaxID=97005 RepID=A0ABD2IWS9_HETSC